MHRLIQATLLSGCLVSLTGIAQFWGVEFPGLMQAYAPAATFGNRNWAGDYLLFILPLAVVPFVLARSLWTEIAWGCVGATAALYFIYAYPRGAWVGLAGASLVAGLAVALRRLCSGAGVPLFSWTRSKTVVSLAYAALVALLVVLPHSMPTAPERALDVPGKLLSIYEMQAPSALTRFAMYRNTLAMIQDHPLLGVGVGNWKIFYPLYARTVRVDPAFSAEVQPTHTHNDFLEICAETGMPGLALWLWIILAALRLAWQAFAHARDPALDLLLLALTTGMLAMLGSALINFPLMAPVPSFFLWSWLGLLHQVAYQKEVPTLRGLSTRRRWHLSAGLRALGWGLAALAVTSFAVFNGFRLLSDFHYRQGVEYRREKKNAQAVHELEAAVWYNPFDYKYLHTLGNAYLDNGMVDEALRTWLATLRYHPYHMNTHNNLGTAYARAGDMQRAFTHFRIALSINPEYPEARNDLGTVYSRMGLLEEAAQEYRKALEIRPDYATAQKNLDALLRYRQGR